MGPRRSPVEQKWVARVEHSGFQIEDGAGVVGLLGGRRGGRGETGGMNGREVESDVKILCEQT